ncbi:MAG: DUF4241 domain-containing protein [Bacteroidota bacterium]
MKYIFILLAFCSCNAATNRSRTLAVSTQPLETIKVAPTNVVASPQIFESVFTPAGTQTVKDQTVNVYGITMGNLKISSGYIVACDPGHIDEYGIPFTQRFPTGEFPVQLAVAKLGLDETIAFARIKFSEEPVAKWEFALQEGQVPIPVGGKEIYGYSVDLGVGIFIDKDASIAIDKTNLTNLDDTVYKKMNNNYRNDWRFSMHEFGQHNLAVFSSGFGDGRYATYIGFDAAGKPCRLLTDFGFFPWKEEKL